MDIQPYILFAVLAFVIAALGITVRVRYRWRPQEKEVDTSDTSSENEEDWPDTWELWRWYVGARQAAHGAGINATIRTVHYSEHLAFYAAQAIGQREGGQLRSHPGANVPLMTVEALDEEIERLLAVHENEMAPDAAVSPAKIQVRSQVLPTC